MARELQGNRALTLISAYAMYISNVDVMLLEQVRHALTIFEAKYPQAQGIFIFDNAPSHIKCGHSLSVVIAVNDLSY